MSKPLINYPDTRLPDITVGARSSQLSRAQIQEVQKELELRQIPLQLVPVYMDTYGDRDRHTSLRELEKTDFFTRDIDQFQLAKGCRLAVHSAKDLPDPLPHGLVLAALTKGVNASDSLVMRPHDTLRTLPPGAIVATSSKRREMAVSLLRSDLTYVDIRGTIHERLNALTTGKVDGVVIAEAALIRLGLTHCNRVRLPGKTVPLQGQLAILARVDDLEARLLVAPLDCRYQHRILYLGLNPQMFVRAYPQASVFHYPVIRTVPRRESCDLREALSSLAKVTHVILTSKMAVTYFLEFSGHSSLKNKHLIAVGKVTASALTTQGLHVNTVAQEETAEGILHALQTIDLTQALCLWPHGNLSRPLIADYFRAHRYPLIECILYDTLLHCPSPPPPLDRIHKIVFTSPSTVDGFLALYGHLPLDKQLISQGPITASYLNKFISVISD